MHYLKDRAFQALNLKQYSNLNMVDSLGKMELEVPGERQYILRILIKKMFGGYQIPEHLNWMLPFIKKCDANQERMGIKQPFVYLTVRNGVVSTETDDEWHVDGFSKTITHLPEQNYIWTSLMPTEYVEKKFNFPEDFSGLKHNIHKFFQNRIEDSDVKVMEEKTIYGFDPYIVHRRPVMTKDVERCFIRISFTPIEIEDINNTYNDLLPTDYKRDGVKEMRDKLIDYDKTL